MDHILRIKKYFKTHLINGDFKDQNLISWETNNMVYSSGCTHQNDLTSSASILQRDIFDINKRYRLTFKMNALSNGLTPRIDIGDNQTFYINNTIITQYIDFTFNYNDSNKLTFYFWSNTFNLGEGLEFLKLDCLDYMENDLNLSEDPGILINYQINDINDISTRNSSYSKSFKIPYTIENSSILENIFNINSITNYTIIKKRYECEYYQNTLLVFKGYFIINDINKNENDNISFIDCEISSQNSDFKTKLGNLKFKNNINIQDDIDFSEYNVILNKTNVINSWNNNSGITFPIIDYNCKNNENSEVYVTNLKPALYVKTVFDKICDKHNIKYKSNFIENNPLFTNLILPYAGQSQPSTEYKDSKKFNVGLITGATGTWAYAPIFGDPDTIVAYSQQTFPKLLFFDKFNATLPNETFNNDNNEYKTNQGPLYLSVYKPDIAIQTNLNFSINFDVEFNLINALGYPFLFFNMPENAEDADANYVSPGFKIIAQLREYDINTGNYIILNNTVNAPGNRQEKYFLLNELYDISSGSLTTGTFNFSGTFSVNAQANHYYAITTNFDFNYLRAFGAYNYSLNSQIATDALIKYVAEGTYFSNEPTVSTVLAEFDMIDCNQIIKKDFTQYQFVNSLFKMFNLYLDDFNIDGTINIEPRDYYLQQGIIKDWTLKIDENEDINISRINTLIDKNIKFTYADDNDDLNSHYKTINTNDRIYGDKLIYTDDNTILDTYEIKLDFSPIPFKNYGNSNVNIPAIYQTVLNTTNSSQSLNQSTSYKEYNQRIAYYFKTSVYPGYQEQLLVLVSSDGSQNTFLGTSHLGGVEFFGTCSHFTSNDNSIIADLNFEKPLIYFNRQISDTNNTLYNLYWANTINEFMSINSKIITLYIKLNEIDLNQFKFNDKIFINGNYYTVNKIIDYSNISKSTKVELLLMDSRSPLDTHPKYTPRIFKTDNMPRIIKNGKGLVITSQDQLQESQPLLQLNSNNLSQQNNNVLPLFIAGLSPNTAILGNNNRNIGNNSLIVGNNIINTIPNSISTDTLIVNNIIQNNNGIIDGGLDTVQDLFNSSSIINIIDGGLDTIKDYGSMSNIEIIDGNTTNNILDVNDLQQLLILKA